MKVIPGRWVLALKYGPAGEVVKYKARWVAKGFHQREGIDYTKTFSSTLKALIWRLLLALTTKYSLIIKMSDVISAFLEALLYKEVWIEQPHGFDNDNKSQACRLNKALYRLK